jgi:hypothetical protein
MDYLVYIAHDAENLQFYLWYRDYEKRFNRLKQNEKALSPAIEPHLAQGLGGGDLMDNNDLIMVDSSSTSMISKQSFGEWSRLSYANKMKSLIFIQ